MKRLNEFATLAAEIEQDVDRMLVARNEKRSHLETSVTDSGIMVVPEETDSLSELKVKLSDLTARLQQLSRPALDDIQREHTLNAIMQGLLGWSEERAARVATSTYNKAWFDAEPDAELRKQLASALLEKYGHSPSSNVSLWRKHAS